MDFSRKAREHATERGYTVSYSMKSDRSIENDILDERIRQPAMGLGNMDRSFTRHCKQNHMFIQDDWEKSPKTDYTYARSDLDSASYNRNYDEQYTHPNMSRPSLRGDRSDESSHSRLNQSDCTDASTHSVKYHLRSRDVLDNLIPLSPGNRESLVCETRSWTSVSNTGTTITTNKKGVLMEDKDNSPMFPARNTISHIYGTDGVSSTRTGLKERRNIFVDVFTTMWTIITYPFNFLLKRTGGGKPLTKRARSLNTPIKQMPSDRSEKAHSNHEYFQSTNFLHSLIGTIGGIIYVFRNLFTYVFGAAAKSSSAVDKSVLSRLGKQQRCGENLVILRRCNRDKTTRKVRDCHFCCLPLIVLATAVLLGSGYLYACGNYPSSAQINDYGRLTIDTLHEYSVYAIETYKRVWEDLVHTKESNDPPPTASDYVPPSPPTQTPLVEPSAPPPNEPHFTPPSSKSECSTGSGIQIREFNERLNELKKNLEESLARKWQIYEDKAKKRQDGDFSSLESMKADFEKFKLEFNEKMEQLKESIVKERLERTTTDVERSAEEITRIERLKVNLQDSFDQFKEEMSKQVEDRHQEIEGHLEVISSATKNGVGEGEIRRNIETHLHEIFSNPDNLKLSSTLLAWLSEKFVSQEEMERRMESTVEKVTSELQLTYDHKVKAEVQEGMDRLRGEVGTTLDATKKELQDEVKVIRARSSTSTSGSSGPVVTPEEVRLAIKDALSKYDADKTGKTDYALESAGGSVLGTRCSKTYKRGMAQLSVFGIPLWYANNSPRTVIQSGSLPGECWPFVGSVGYMVIQLSTKVHIKEVSLEHVNVNITTFGRVDSAPKEFAVWGLADANDHEGTNLGNFTYDAQGEPIQFFHIAPALQILSFLHVELRVYSNHGNEEYTCLYRFRVHGSPDTRVTGEDVERTDDKK